MIKKENTATIGNVLKVAQLVRTNLIHKYSESGLEGKCKEAADMLIQALKSQGINASKHFGWCVYDTCENMTGEPCAPHCYVLVHSGTSRIYLDCTATQFQYALETKVPNVIIMPSGTRPYWFREKKPSIKEMERVSGYEY